MLSSLGVLRFFPGWLPKFLIVLLAFVLMEGVCPAVAVAGKPLVCRAVEGHQVCVESIKRSAKNFWEYRAQLKVDGKPQPLERYDCRRSLRLSLASGPEAQPSKQALHQFVCNLVNRG